MKRLICNTCGLDVPADDYGLPPKGWFTVIERGSGKQDMPDFCSQACLLSHYMGNDAESTIKDAEAAGLHPAALV